MTNAPVKTDAMGFDNFSRFSEEFEGHCRSRPHIMDVPLLYMVRNAFGYDIISLSNYQDGRFRGVEIVGDIDIPVIKEYYLHNFQKRDPFAAHINRTCARDASVGLLQSSEVFGGRYFNNDYYRFLHQFGISYALTIPVGEYRMTFYKDAKSGDFTPHEHSAMQLLSAMMRGRYKTHCATTRSAAAADAQSNLLDSMGVGFLTVDKQFPLAGSNQAALDFLHEQAGNVDERQAAAQLVEQVRAGGKRMLSQHRAIWMELAGYTLLLEGLETGLPADGHCTLTIYPPDRQAREVESDKLARRYGLTQREIETARQLVSGCSYQEAADRLFISINTVRTHVRNIYKKTGIRNQRMLSTLFL